MEKENSELKELINNTETNDDNKSVSKNIFSNILNQCILLAGSALLTILIDYLLPLLGYRLVNESGAAFLFTLCIYFVGNILLGVFLEKRKSKKTIEKK